jgi:NAD(P)-dependent dehydrogenase (short-subunit alcohol dehydrogenase family)
LQRERSPDAVVTGLSRGIGLAIALKLETANTNAAIILIAEKAAEMIFQ